MPPPSLSLIHISFDGMSIARAVVEHIADPAKGLGCKTLFATHYHELTELEGTVEEMCIRDSRGAAGRVRRVLPQAGCRGGSG